MSVTRRVTETTGVPRTGDFRVCLAEVTVALGPT